MSTNLLDIPFNLGMDEVARTLKLVEPPGFVNPGTPTFSRRSYWRAFSGGLPVYAYGGPPAGTNPTLITQEGCPVAEYTTTTSNATPTTIWSSTLPPNATATLRVSVTGQEVGGSKRISTQLLIAAYRVGGGANLMGPTVVLYIQKTDSGLDADFAVVGNDVQLLVTGLAATNFDWTALVEPAPAS